ncbi:IpaD/SipD/SspD family type III secretion system needle tip protein [Proteus cibi]|uniref:IpaD/SipD/SspD family type III secretion system needle tip protein n=1 Tax=Proteus cibi TaxID=2050966 RepID=UPI0032DB7FD4
MVNPTSYNNIKHQGFELNNNDSQSDFVSNNNKHNKIITDFNTEGERVKLKLQSNLDDYTLSEPEKIKHFHSTKEESIINKNIYAKNSHNAKKLEQQISDLQYVESKINPPQSHSLREFFSEVKSSIICGKHDYLDVYKDIFSKYMNYVNDLRSAISTLNQCTKAASKPENINVQFPLFKEKLIEVKRKYENIESDKHFFYSNLFFQHKENGFYLRKINDYSISYINKNQVDDAIKTIEKSLKDIKGINITKNDELLGSDLDVNTLFIGNIDFSDLDKFIESIDVSGTAVDGILSDDDLIKIRENLVKRNKRLTGIQNSWDSPININGFYNSISDSVKNLAEDVHEGGVKVLFGVKAPKVDVDARMKKIIKENDERKEKAKWKNISQPEFDLFKKTLDTLEKKINTNLDELSKKYSAANSNYDNFVKIVSSTMNTLLEMAKSFLRF